MRLKRLARLSACGWFRQTVLKMAAEKDMLPDEDAAQEKARREMNETIITLGKLKQHAFDKTKVKAYILCGLV